MDSKERFSNRANIYASYRPSYPDESIDYLFDTVGMNKNSVVADIGSGTATDEI